MEGRSNELAFSECVGQSISPISTPRREGTLGVYLKVGDEGVVCALTCRHVVFGVFETETALNDTITDTSFHRGVAQPGLIAFSRVMTEETDIAMVEGESAFLKKISAQKELKDRRIGHVFFSPARVVDADLWLHDWLLVKLDAKRYASLSALQNWAWVTRAESRRAILPPLRNKTRPEFKADLNRVRLKDTVTEAEILQTTANDEPTRDYEALWVHMVDIKGNELSTGISNEVRSVRRMSPAIGNSEIITTREWCVVGRNSDNGILHGIDSQGTRLQPFSMSGNSGAAVFDSQGRIAGILTSGCGFREDRE